MIRIPIRYRRTAVYNPVSPFRSFVLFNGLLPSASTPIFCSDQLRGITDTPINNHAWQACGFRRFRLDFHPLSTPLEPPPSTTSTLPSGICLECFFHKNIILKHLHRSNRPGKPFVFSERFKFNCTHLYFTVKIHHINPL